MVSGQRKSAAGTTARPANARNKAARNGKQEPALIIDPDRAVAELCKRELSEFVQEFWDTVIAEPLIWEPHMDVLCMEIQAAFERLFMRYEVGEDGELVAIGRQAKEYDLIINIPPGTSKSTIVTVMAPVWAWVNDPTLRFITGSYSGRVSLDQAVKSRDIIRSPRFKLLFPELQVKDDEDGKSNYKTTQLGQRFSTSTGGSATSQHAHCIIIDDPLNPKQAVSELQLDAANNWLDSTLSTRKVDKAVSILVLIMQRLATNDPTGHLISNKKGKRIRHICLPGELSGDVKPRELRAIYQDGLLSPARMNREILAELAVDMGSYNYAGQIMQRPIPLGGGIWKRWFIEVPDELFPSLRLMQQVATDWDLAYTSNQKNSASAYVTSGKIDHRIYIDDIGWDWLEFPALIKWMKSKPGPHYIEAKASGKSAKQTLTRKGVIAIEVKVKGGEDKVARANMATPVAESGIVYIRKSLVDRLYNDSRQGILLFPKGEFADLADVIAQMLQRRDSRGEIKVGRDSDDEEEDLLDM